MTAVADRKACLANMIMVDDVQQEKCCDGNAVLFKSKVT